MKILVTGGAGFIGSNVVDAYIREGHDVVVVDNLYSGKLENLNPKARFYLMDIRSDEIEKVLDIERPDVINHHAAQISVPYSVEDPRFDCDVNIKGFVNLLESSKDKGVKKIIFISSGGAIYGEAEEYPTTENYPPKPLSPYAIAKAVSEDFLYFYKHQYGIDYTVLRYANIYGPRQIPHGEAGVVAIFMDRLLSGKKCTLFHFPEDKRGMIRDYCFVGDVVEANIKALTKGGGQAFNIGTGIETKTQDLFEKIFDVISERVPLDKELFVLNKEEARAGDLKKSCLNCEKAKRELGWEPKHSLKEGLKKTLDWRLKKN